MLKIICSFIWDFCETMNISLGKLAPYVFGGMIGSKPVKIKKEDENNEL